MSGIQTVYIGYPDQQQSVIAQMGSDMQRLPSGIFVVGGAGRTGKTTTVTQALTIASIPIASRKIWNEVKPFSSMKDSVFFTV